MLDTSDIFFNSSLPLLQNLHGKQARLANKGPRTKLAPIEKITESRSVVLGSIGRGHPECSEVSSEHPKMPKKKKRD